MDVLLSNAEVSLIMECYGISFCLIGWSDVLSLLLGGMREAMEYCIAV